MVGGNAFSDYFGRVFGYPAAMGFEGKPVTKIGEAAFLLCTNLTSAER